MNLRFVKIDYYISIFFAPENDKESTDGIIIIMIIIDAEIKTTIYEDGERIRDRERKIFLNI